MGACVLIGLGLAEQDAAAFSDDIFSGCRREGKGVLKI